LINHAFYDHRASLPWHHVLGYHYQIVPEVTLPVTAISAVDMMITDLAVFKFIDRQLTLTELMPGATLEQVRSLTTAKFLEALSA
jgi:3-oxoacid CoA-transferase